MKINLDSEPQDMGTALNLAFRVIAENPQQEEGSVGAIYVRSSNNIVFEVIKNQDSHTIRSTSVGENIESQ